MSRPSAQNRTQLQAIARRVMTERGLQPDFSAEARAEVETITKPAAESGSGIRDLTGLLWASIDNDDSRDLDQLSVAEPLTGGAAKVLVAVADVDALVKKSSAIDEHARVNTTSVYTAAQVFPMLPEKLSTDLTSLGEGQKRLALVVEMVVGPDGQVRESAVYRALVLNRAKLAYNSVAAWRAGSTSSCGFKIAWRRP
jgi:exoribonuclease R